MANKSLEADNIFNEYSNLYWELNDYSKPIGSIPNIREKERRLLELKMKYESIIEEMRNES